MEAMEVAVRSVSTSVTSMQSMLKRIESSIAQGADRPHPGPSEQPRAVKDVEKSGKEIFAFLQKLRIYKPASLAPLVGKAFLGLCGRSEFPTSLLVALGCPSRAPLTLAPPEYGPTAKKCNR